MIEARARVLMAPFMGMGMGMGMGGGMRGGMGMGQDMGGSMGMGMDPPKMMDGQNVDNRRQIVEFKNI